MEPFGATAQMGIFPTDVFILPINIPHLWITFSVFVHNGFSSPKLAGDVEARSGSYNL